MKILLATEVIHPGGAETFVLRLANALQQRGHEVNVFSFYKEHYHEQIHLSLAPAVKVLWPRIPLNWQLQKVDGLLFKLKADHKFRDTRILNSLKKIIGDVKPDVIHSHLLKVDKMAIDATEGTSIPVVTTIHGDYIQFYTKVKNGIPVPLLNYKKKAERNLAKLKRIVCITDKQVDFFNNTFPLQTKGKLTKIYNGYEGIKPQKTGIELRASLGIKQGDFVFGIVSRGIREKGWQEAITALQQLNDTRAHLVMIGESDYLTQLSEGYKNDRQIHFIGQSYEPLEWINIFDAGMLPSTYGSESLPTVVIEYLYCNKPVIASDAGELRSMIQKDGKPAGIIVPVREGKIPIDDLAAAMKKYMNDKDYYNEHKENTEICFSQFDMDECVAAYVDVYTKAAQKN